EFYPPPSKEKHYLHQTIFPIKTEKGYRIATLTEDITERKRVEQELRETNELLRAIIEAAPTAIIGLDLEGRVHTVWNPAAEKMLGWSAQEAMGNFLPSVPVEKEDEFRRFRDLIRSGQTLNGIEVQRQKRDGTPIDYSIYASALHNPEGQITGNVAVLVDITERKRAEQERLAHLRFFECMDQINRAMQGTNDLEQMMRDVLDATLAIFDCDRAWLVYPCDPEATLWQVPMERTRPEYPSVLPLGVELPMDPAGATVFRILRGATGPVKFGPRSERPVPVEIAQGFRVQSFIAMAIYPKVGKPWVFGLHQCSYPRVWTAEEERLFQEIGRRLSDALSSLLMYRDLQESEAKFSTAFRSSPSALSVSSAQNRIYLDVNESFLQATGYARAEVVGHTSAELNLWAEPEQRARYRQLLEEHGSVHNFECAFRRKNGEVG
ncbi:MAG: PAS domain S-box protein, partial [Chloroflexi bacterium]|nr:PAS domain S-box protein [Chloroflexota bacterium]